MPADKRIAESGLRHLALDQLKLPPASLTCTAPQPEDSGRGEGLSREAG